MSTAIAAPPAPTTATDQRIIEYIPFGETKPIRLTMAMTRSHIAVPTRKGQLPSDSDLIKFMMLCEARGLNPWVGDAFLVGYDTQDGPKFSLITAIQSLLKRAEVNPHFDGIESGVIVLRGDEIKERVGDLLLNGEKLVGAWAKCYRNDRSIPYSETLNLSTYDTGYSQWKKDPAGMIVKCAEASVLRKAFPSQIGSLYIEQERGMMERAESTPRQAPQKLTAITQALTPAQHAQAIATKTYPERVIRTNEESQEDTTESSGGRVAGGEAEMRDSNPPVESQDSTPAANTPAVSVDWGAVEYDLAEAERASRPISEIDNAITQWMQGASDDDAERLKAIGEERKAKIRSKRGPGSKA